MRARLLGILALMLCWMGSPCSTLGQLVEDFRPPKAQCCVQSAAQPLADQLQDWNQLGKYYEDNRSIEAQPPQQGRVVFLGDSITEGWELNRYFPGKPYINRGISGQTTPQMLVRTYPDVIDLHPAVVILLAGANDIAANTGPETLKMIEENIQAMTELAQMHGIKVVLSSVMPVSDYTEHKQTLHLPPTDILKLNAWLRRYAGEARAEFADYYSTLVDSNGMMKAGYSDDGLHPNPKGYTLVAPVATAAIERALR